MDTLGEKWLDYCFVEHRNTDYPHAHILAWSKSQVNQTERKRMYERVKELEVVRDRERTPEQQVAQAARAQRFLSAFGPIREHFCPRRHRLKAAEYRRERVHRFQAWKEVTNLQMAA